MGVDRGGDAEGAGLGDRFAQEVDQRVVDARVLDASGSEKKPHAASQSHHCRRERSKRLRIRTRERLADHGKLIGSGNRKIERSGTMVLRIVEGRGWRLQ